EARGAQDGVPHVPAGVHRDAVPDHPSRTTDRLSAADVESVAAGVAPRGRRSSAAAALLTETHPGGVGRKPTATTRFTNEGARRQGSLNRSRNQRPGRPEGDPCLYESGRRSQLPLSNRACLRASVGESTVLTRGERRYVARVVE